MSFCKVVICGNGGASVALLLALAKSRRPLSVTLVGSGARVGEGIAYATRNDHHLLNVPAARMSADADDPDQFVTWLAARDISPADWAGQFVARRLYGEYLHDQVSRLAAGHRNLKLHCLTSDVTSLVKRPRGWMVVHSTGTLDADLVVLATGNDMPSPLVDRHGPDVAALIADNPWGPLTIKPTERVLVLGAGLTAVDTVLSLSGRGHTGDVILLSRHGLLPRTHHLPKSVAPLAPPYPTTSLALLRALRWSVGPNPSPEIWQGFMDAMRPHWCDVWAAMPRDERKRCLRHATIWNMHRHRIAPQAAKQLGVALAKNTKVMKGNLVCLSRAGPDELTATIRRQGREFALTVNRVFNCMGPNSDTEKTNNPLIENIIASRQARTDETGIGLAVDTRNRLLDPDGQAQPSLLAMGALTRGRWWEVTAMPEIAQQAAHIADYIFQYRPQPAEPPPRLS